MFELNDDEAKLALTAVALTLVQHQGVYRSASAQVTDMTLPYRVRRQASQDVNWAAERVNVYCRLHNRLQAAVAAINAKELV